MEGSFQRSFHILHLWFRQGQSTCTFLLPLSWILDGLYLLILNLGLMGREVERCVWERESFVFFYNRIARNRPTFDIDSVMTHCGWMDCIALLGLLMSLGEAQVQYQSLENYVLESRIIITGKIVLKTLILMIVFHLLSCSRNVPRRRMSVKALDYMHILHKEVYLKRTLT